MALCWYVHYSETLDLMSLTPPFQLLTTLKPPWLQSSLLNKPELLSKLISRTLLLKEPSLLATLSIWSAIFINLCTQSHFITKLIPREMLEETFFIWNSSTEQYQTSTLSGMPVHSDFKMTHTTLSDQWTCRTPLSLSDLLQVWLTGTAKKSKNWQRTSIQPNGLRNHSWLLRTQHTLSWWTATLPQNNTQTWCMKHQERESLWRVTDWPISWLAYSVKTDRPSTI